MNTIPEPQLWFGTTEVPENFRFTVKLWQGITHEPQLNFTPTDVDKFMHAANQLGTKKGCLLIQLPPSLQADKADQFRRLLDQIKRSDPQQDWNLAVEFRFHGPAGDYKGGYDKAALKEYAEMIKEWRTLTLKAATHK